MRTIDILSFTAQQPCWIDMLTNLKPGEVSPAIHLSAPLDWSEYERLRQLSVQSVANDDGTRSQALDNNQFLRRLVEATRPDDWRGFTKDGAPLAFSANTLLTLLRQNYLLGVRFREAIAGLSVTLQFALEEQEKNSDAGRATPDTAPGSQKKTKEKADKPSA